jgi:hypothetical protein
VAGLARADGVGFKELLVPVHPILVVHRMQPMWTSEVGRQGTRNVAHHTLDYLPRVPLKLAGGHIVIRDVCSARWADRRFGMGAPMASLAEDSRMVVFAEPV